jgi:hypothetical protein
MHYDSQWLAILRTAEPFRSIQRNASPLPRVSEMAAALASDLAWIQVQQVEP